MGRQGRFTIDTRARTSAIANIGSSITFAPILALCTDAATKSAVEGYTEVLQAEVAAFGIGVLLVKPGATATEFASEIGSGIKVESSEPYQEGILKYVSNMTNLSRSAPNVAISVAVVERVVEAIDGTGSWLGRSYGFATRLGKT